MSWLLERVSTALDAVDSSAAELLGQSSSNAPRAQTPGRRSAMAPIPREPIVEPLTPSPSPAPPPSRRVGVRTRAPAARRALSTTTTTGSTTRTTTRTTTGSNDPLMDLLNAPPTASTTASTTAPTGPTVSPPVTTPLAERVADSKRRAEERQRRDRLEGDIAEMRRALRAAEAGRRAAQQSLDEASDRLAAAEEALQSERAAASDARAELEDHRTAAEQAIARERAAVQQAQADLREYRIKAERVLAAGNKEANPSSSPSSSSSSSSSSSCLLSLGAAAKCDELRDTVDRLRSDLAAAEQRAREAAERIHDGAGARAAELARARAERDEERARAERMVAQQARREAELAAERDEWQRQEAELRVRISDLQTHCDELESQSATVAADEGARRDVTDARYDELMRRLYEKQSQLETVQSEKLALEIRLEDQARRAMVGRHDAPPSPGTSAVWMESGSGRGGRQPVPVGPQLPWRSLVGPEHDPEDGVLIGVACAVDHVAARLAAAYALLPRARVLLLVWLIFTHAMLVQLWLQRRAATAGGGGTGNGNGK